MHAERNVMYLSFLIGPTGKIATWNAACQKILGYAEREILLRPIVSLLREPARKACQDRLREARSDVEELEAEIIHANGLSSPVNLTFVPQFRRSGKFSGYSVIISTATDNRLISETDVIGHRPVKDMVDFLAGPFYVVNQSGHLVMWNKKVEQVTQLTHAEIEAKHVLDFFSAEEKNIVGKKLVEVFEHDGDIVVEANVLAKDGTETPYLMSGSRFSAGNKLYLCGMGLDISERRKQEERLRLRERALHASSNGIVITRCAGKENPIEYVNPAFERITGYREEEVIGRDSRFMAAPGLDEWERAQLRMAINECRETNVIFRNLRKNGELFWNDLTITPVQNEKGVVTHFIGVIIDITASKHRTSHLEHEINHDALTGLANRNLLWDRLEQAINVAQRNKTLVATVLVDLDNFKIINDTMGHDAGDEVLKVIARRLQESVRDSDTVARLSGDEFVLILYNQPSSRFMLRMIDRLRLDMAKAVVVDHKEISIGASMGVSIYPHDGTSVLELIKAADVAMYHAKEAGRNDVHFFSADMRLKAETKHNFEMSMRNAIEKNEMFLLFQPKICLKTGRIVGAEALLRWRHPEQGVLLPASFIHEAEENGLIVSFGKWVFDNICTMLQRLKDLGFHHLVVSMNVSFQEFSQKNYVAFIGEKLSEFKLPPEIFELEIKESHLMRNPLLATKILDEIRQLGIKLTIDDFGAELSSLSNLQKLPVNHLKIPKSFIEKICENDLEGVMAKIMIGIGHNLNIGVIAEGVENSGQLNFLKSNDCDEIQGNYFSRPICQGAFEKLLNDTSNFFPAAST